MGSYLLGPGDELTLVSEDPQELNVDTVVSEDGHVTLPIVGTVSVQGLTKIQFTDMLHQQLGLFIRKPNVRIRVKKYASQRVTVIGAVNKPGEVTLDTGNNTLLRVLGKAGGLSSRAANFVQFIPKEFADQQLVPDYTIFVLGPQEQTGFYPTSIELSLSRLYGTEGQPPLQIPTIGGDVVIVPEFGKILVDGEVEKRGAFELGSRMTLLGALAAAGGITYSARVDAVEVIRQVSPSQKAHLVVDLDDVLEGKEQDIPLHPGDVVRIPTHKGRQLARDTYDAISKMIQIGIGGNVDLLSNSRQQ